MESLKKLQLVFQTMADYNRLVMIKTISDRECSVGELVKATNLSQPLVSHHLRVMKDNGILETKRKGPFIYYYLCDPQLLYAIDLFIEVFKNTDLKFEPEFRFCPDWMFKKYKN
jgi:DNA-binding transcriptional ArsR family regulator